MGQKRRRLALSCVDCRRRKVKCGRELPSCVRCIRGGQGDTCKYVAYDPGNLLTPEDDSPEGHRDDHSEAEDSWTEEAATYHKVSKSGAKAIATQPNGSRQPVKRPPAPTRTLEELQERVFELETYMRSAGAKPVSQQMYLGLGHPQGPGTRPKDKPQEFERSLLRGRSFKTQYYGPSNAVSLLLQFEELSVFVKDILARMPNFEKSRDVFKKVRSTAETSSGSKPLTAGSLESFAAMVPPRERADLLVHGYLDIFETTYRVLHVPSFLQSYEAFWTEPESVEIEFVVQMLLVMAAINCVFTGGAEGFIGRSSVGRTTSHRWLEAVEVWLDQQSHKHTTLEYYQTHVLLLIAKVMTCYKIKREWIAAQSLLSMAMSAGLHREPTTLSNKISPFDQEMRRRLWYTILEINLEISCDRGMRVSIGPDDWDCLPPLNVHDEDFNESTQTLPTSKPLGDFTRTSFLAQQTRHLPLRIDILTRVNSISRTLDLETVMQFDNQIREELDNLATWPEKSITEAARALATLVPHDYLLLLHQPFATQRLAQSQYFYSRCTRRESSLHIMKTYAELSEPAGLTMGNIRCDGFRASLAACHDIAVAAGGREDMMQDKTLTVNLISKFVDLSGRRVKALGQGFHSYWMGSSALSLAKMKLSSATEPEEFVLESVNRMVKLHNDLMEMQTAGYDHTPTAEVMPQPDLPLPTTIMQAPVQTFDMNSMLPYDTLNTAMFDFDFDDSQAWWADQGLGVLT
jgi:hypothetical protein